MIFLKKKDFEEEVQRRIWEEQRRQETFQRFERMDKRICDLEMQLYDLRMKTDPEFRRRNTPTCSCEEVTTCNGQ